MVHISIFIPFNSLKMWEKALRKCTHSAHFVLSFIVGNISVGFAAQLIDHPLTFQSTFFLKLHFLFCYGVMTLLFVCFTHYSFACVWRDIDPQKWKLFGNGKGRPVYLCARSALVSILEQLERLICTSLSVSIRQPCRLHPEICMRRWTNMEDKYRENISLCFCPFCPFALFALLPSCPLALLPFLPFLPWCYFIFYFLRIDSDSFFHCTSII